MKEIEMMDPLLNALCKKYEGEIAAAIVNINVYRTNPVGIGEHPNLVAAVDSEVVKLAVAIDKLNAIKDNFTLPAELL